MTYYLRNDRRRRSRLFGQLSNAKQKPALAADAGLFLPTAPVDTPARVDSAVADDWERLARDCRIPYLARLLVSGLGGWNLSVALSEPVTFLGRDGSCRVRFTDDRLSPRHYVLFWLSGALYGIDLDHAGRHPDDKVGHWWTEATSVLLGAYRLRVEGIAPVEFAARAAGASLPLQLHWLRGEGLHTERLRARLTLIGAGASCSIRLHDPKLAAAQAALVRTPWSLALVDLAGNSWTRRMGQPIEWCLLDPGDEFEIGGTVFQVSGVWDDHVGEPIRLQQSAETSEVADESESHWRSFVQRQAERLGQLQRVMDQLQQANVDCEPSSQTALLEQFRDAATDCRSEAARWLETATVS